MIHKFYNSNNITHVFLSPYCKVVENTNSRICVINRISNESIILKGTEDLLDMFRKAFLLNAGMQYDDIGAFFAKFENCTSSTWQVLIQGGFLE